jgi:hypothetical protein
LGCQTAGKRASAGSKNVSPCYRCIGSRDRDRDLFVCEKADEDLSIELHNFSPSLPSATSVELNVVSGWKKHQGKYPAEKARLEVNRVSTFLEGETTAQQGQETGI